MKKYILFFGITIIFSNCRSEESAGENPPESGKQEQIVQNKQGSTGSPNNAVQSPFLNSKVNKESKTTQDKLAANNLDEVPAGSTIVTPQVKKEYIPKISMLISKAKISKLVGVEQSLITEKEITNRQNPDKLRSCFYKWKEPGNEDAGIFIQIQANPIGDELPNWAHEFMKSKYQSGELTYPSDGKTYKYTKFDGIAEEAAFCHELKKVVWRPNDDLIVTIVDNYRVSDKDRIRNAKEIASIFNPQLNLK